MLWLQQVLKELKNQVNMPMKLYCDNKATINIAHNPVQYNRTKHVKINRSIIKKKLEVGVICMSFLPTMKQTIDILTKGLFQPNFKLLISKLSMIDIYAPT